MAKCIQELERIKGIKQGSGGNTTNPNYSDCKTTQSELSNELNISQDSLGNYKKLLKLIPDLQQMVENGSMKATVGYKIWAKMSEKLQEKFFNDIGIVLKPY